MLASAQTTNGQTYGFSYAYNLAHGMTQMTYPTGRTVSWNYDAGNRVAGVGGTAPGGSASQSYAFGISYAAQGPVSQLTLGNGLVEGHTYDAYRQQPTGVTLGTTAGSNGVLGLGFSYCASGTSPCSTNNGNVVSQTISNLAATQTYGYDGFNRITSAAETARGSTTWSEGFGYDNFGNRWVSSASGIAVSPLTPTAGSNYNLSNQLVASGNYGYDAAGNGTFLSPYTVSYDGENRQTAIASSLNGSAAYTYDGEGRRVTKTVGGATTVYVYDAAGEMAGEYSMGAQNAPCQTCYLTTDPLGSIRAVTDPSGGVVSLHDYLPFGEELAAGRPYYGYGLVDGVSRRFTGKERDAETGLDWFNVRYYSGAQGRFTSPDQPFIDQDPSNPQSWNLFGYGRNNPLRYSDPTGRKCVDTNNGPADDGTGGGCAAAGVDENGNITPQTVNAVDISQRGGDVFVNGQIVAEGSLENDYAADFGLLGLVRGAFGGLLGGAAAGSSGPSVWSLGNFTRGSTIERALGANLPRTFPTIDKFINGVATSIKSVDLRAVTYQNPANLTRLLTNYVDKVAEFSGATLGEYAVNGSQITGRALEVAIPQGGMTAAQQAAINSVVSAAAQKGVRVVLVPIR